MKGQGALLSNAKATADATAALFGSRVEVVVHDLKSETIAHISQPYSNRKPGDPSNMQEIDLGPHDTVIGPYEKVNWDGSLIRSISVVIRDESGEARFVLCVNHDQSDIQQLQMLARAFAAASPATGQPEMLFRQDWHEKLNLFVSEWCAARAQRADALDRETRRALIMALDMSGALAERNAASYIARMLRVSRATIYNDLKAGVATADLLK